MRWLRHRKARVDRDAGLVFAWRGMNSGLRRKVAAVLLVLGAAVSLAVAVRVRVVPPVPVGQRQGSVTVATTGEAFAFLLGRLDESSPFPVRFETREWAELEAPLSASLAAAGRGTETYRPRLRELPARELGDELPALTVGQPVFPPLPEPSPTGLAAKAPDRLTAALVPDSGELAARVLTPVPELAIPGDPAKAGRSARFLIEVRADGTVGSVVPVGGVDHPEMPGVETWLTRLRFDASGGVAGWHMVEARWIPEDD